MLHNCLESIESRGRSSRCHPAGSEPKGSPRLMHNQEFSLPRREWYKLPISEILIPSWHSELLWEDENLCQGSCTAGRWRRDRDRMSSRLGNGSILCPLHDDKVTSSSIYTSPHTHRVLHIMNQSANPFHGTLTWLFPFPYFNDLKAAIPQIILSTVLEKSFTLIKVAIIFISQQLIDFIPSSWF